MNKALANVLMLAIVATMAAPIMGDPATEPFRGYCRVCKDARRIEPWHDAYFCDICGWESSVQPMKLHGDVPADVNLEPPQRTPAEPVEPATPKKATPTKPKDEPYSLKGDKVGMRLSEFKRKYTRLISRGTLDRKLYAPFCSDEDQASQSVMLLTEPWHSAQGIVSCTKEFPFEYIQDESKTPTVAGVPTSLLVYQFVDGFLYQIYILLPHDGYHEVRRGLEKKWGPPTSQSNATAQNAMGATFSSSTSTWTNDVSRIQLMERAGRVDLTFLSYVDLELLEVVKERTPDTSADDL